MRKKNEVLGLIDGFYNLVLTKLRLYVGVHGVGTRQSEDTFATLHERTDALSYASKRDGKNRISVTPPEGMDVSVFPDCVNIVTAAGKPN